MDASASTPWSDRLRQERIQRNWRQQDLANQLGTTVITIHRWERGHQQPSAYFRLKLCTLFGKSAEELGLVPESSPSAASRETDASASVESQPHLGDTLGAQSSPSPDPQDEDPPKKLSVCARRRSVGLLVLATVLIMILLISAGEYIYVSVSKSSLQMRATAPAQTNNAATSIQQTLATNTASNDLGDPQTTGCWNNAYIAKSGSLSLNGTQVAQIDNWHSRSCNTTWIEITYNTSVVTGTTIDIHQKGTRLTANPSLHHQCYPTDCSSWYTGRLSPSWSDMVDGNSMNCIFAGVRNGSSVETTSGIYKTNDALCA